MRTIIAGSRGIEDYKIIYKAVVQSGFTVTEVVSGCARGVDILGELYAFHHGLPTRQFPALWDIYGKSAGYRRNLVMADNADQLIAIWDGKSRGTKHMIDIMTERCKPVYVHKVGE